MVNNISYCVKKKNPEKKKIKERKNRNSNKCQSCSDIFKDIMLQDKG